MPIVIRRLTHIYDIGNPCQTVALKNINITINEGEMVGLIGHTGSGKSTLIQHLNGLVKPTEGVVEVDGVDIAQKKVKLDEIRKKVGLVFQYPEYQLFEETIAKDVAFGPIQQGLSKEDVEYQVKEAMEIVGLDYEEFKDRSPFELSGGQRRRAAIAGILAMNPKYLILDEPTAGLDPKGRAEVFGQIQELHRKKNISVLLVSHSMEDVARLVSRILVLHKGELVLDDKPQDIFKNVRLLNEIGLGVPQISELAEALKEKGMDLGDGIYTVEAAKEKILSLVKGTSKC